MCRNVFLNIEEVYSTEVAIILQFLNENQKFINFSNEYEGDFDCYYEINGWTVDVTCRVGGTIKVFLRPFRNNDIIDNFYIASAFAVRVEDLLNIRGKNQLIPPPAAFV